MTFTTLKIESYYLHCFAGVKGFTALCLKAGVVSSQPLHGLHQICSCAVCFYNGISGLLTSYVVNLVEDFSTVFIFLYTFWMV